MAIYLKKFETQAAYEAAQSGLILPNVSLTVDNNAVHYNPSTPIPPTPSHDYVEIGGIKWATMNVGANSVTDYGLYFQWGDTQGYAADQCGSGSGQKYFSWEDYKYSEGGTASYYDTLTKYNDSDELITLQPSDDAVTAAWGGNWRMPTNAEIKSLEDATNSGWTTNYQGSGISGMTFTDKTDSSKVLFFPAAGFCFGGSISDVGGKGCYWSSSISSVGSCGKGFLLNSYEIIDEAESDRVCGFTVRGIFDE